MFVAPVRHRSKLTSHALVAVIAVVLLAVTTLSLSQQARAISDEPWITLADSSFTSARDAQAMAAPGPGRWAVRKGSYVLTDVDAQAPAAPQDQPLSLLRARPTTDNWQLEAVVRSTARKPDVSVVVSYQDQDNYWFVRLSDQDAGFYQVVRGNLVRRGGIDASLPLRRGRATAITLDAADGSLTVRVGARGQTGQVAGRDLRLPGGGAHLGVASPHPGFAVLSLRLRERRNPPTPSTTVITTSTPSTPSSTVTPSTPSSTATPTTPTSTATTTTPTPTSPVTGLRQITVTNARDLAAALLEARPGDVITMTDGVYTSDGVSAPLVLGGKRYSGTFVGAVSGTADHPIVLQGTVAAIIDAKPGGDGTTSQYGLYLAGADHWQVRGISVRNVSKGVVLDESDHVRLEELRVQDTGQEGIHLRAFSSDNVVVGNTVSHTGRSNATYGEGIYVGSAYSNWSTYSGGAPDASDRNQLIGNSISRTGAESIDIKEGTTGGLVEGNTFDGAGMTGGYADSWIDLKGNDWSVLENTGVNALKDGFQVHGALSGWGHDNLFRDNVADVQGTGYGFWLQTNVTGNLISCDNVVLHASFGFANEACRE